MSLAVAVLVAGEILFYTGQGFFSKLFSLSHPGKASDATPGFNMIYGLVVALGTWVFTGFRLRPDALTLVIGSINGVSLFFYNFSAIHAAQSGPYSLQSLMSSFGNILIPMIISFSIWGDRLNGLQLTGIAFMMGAFVLFNSAGLKSLKTGQKGFIWFVMVFIMNGVYSSFNDAQQRLEAGAHRQDMIIITFLTAALFSIAYSSSSSTTTTSPQQAPSTILEEIPRARMNSSAAMPSASARTRSSPSPATVWNRHSMPGMIF